MVSIAHLKSCPTCQQPFTKTHQSQAYCPSCNSAYRKERRKQGYDKLSHEVNRDRNLRRNHGITLEEYTLMLFQQGGVCAICKRPETSMDHYTGKPKPLYVDHNHATGQIRQLLCHHCNFLIGFIEKDRERVRQAMKYLQVHDR